MQVCLEYEQSLFSWSVEQNARDTQMPSFLASRGFAAQRLRARALPSLNLKKKRDCSQSKVCLTVYTNDRRNPDAKLCPLVCSNFLEKRTGQRNRRFRDSLA